MVTKTTTKEGPQKTGTEGQALARLGARLDALEELAIGEEFEKYEIDGRAIKPASIPEDRLGSDAGARSGQATGSYPLKPEDGGVRIVEGPKLGRGMEAHLEWTIIAPTGSRSGAGAWRVDATTGVLDSIALEPNSSLGSPTFSTPAFQLSAETGRVGLVVSQAVDQRVTARVRWMRV